MEIKRKANEDDNKPVIVEYTQAGQTLARVKFHNKKMFRIAEAIRVNYILFNSKLSIDRLMTFWAAQGVRVEHDIPDYTVDIRQKRMGVEEE